MFEIAAWTYSCSVLTKWWCTHLQVRCRCWQNIINATIRGARGRFQWFKSLPASLRTWVQILELREMLFGQGGDGIPGVSWLTRLQVSVGSKFETTCFIEYPDFNFRPLHTRIPICIRIHTWAHTHANIRTHENRIKLTCRRPLGRYRITMKTEWETLAKSQRNTKEA